MNGRVGIALLESSSKQTERLRNLRKALERAKGALNFNHNPRKQLGAALDTLAGVQR